MIDPTARLIAVLSLIISVIKILYDLLKDWRRIKVLMDQTISKEGKFITISIVNTGHRSIKIEGLGVIFDKKKMLAYGKAYFRG